MKKEARNMGAKAVSKHAPFLQEPTPAGGPLKTKKPLHQEAPKMKTSQLQEASTSSLGPPKSKKALLHDQEIKTPSAGPPKLKNSCLQEAKTITAPPKTKTLSLHDQEASARAPKMKKSTVQEGKTPPAGSTKNQKTPLQDWEAASSTSASPPKNKKSPAIKEARTTAGGALKEKVSLVQGTVKPTGGATGRV